jgi:hypothetical protein
VERGVGAVLVRERARRAVDGEELVDESALPEEETRALQDAERAAGRGGAGSVRGESIRVRERAVVQERAEDVSEGVGVAGDGIRAGRERQRERLEATTLRLDVRVRLLPWGLAEQAKQLGRVRHADRRPARDPRRRSAPRTVPRGDAGREASDVAFEASARALTG